MRSGRGLQADVLASLAVVMVTATAVLVALLVATHQAHIRDLRRLAARSLVEQARAPLGGTDLSGIQWWISEPDGRIEPQAGTATPRPAALGELADEAGTRGQPLLRAGAPWDVIHLAAPLGGGRVAAAEIPAAISRAWVLAAFVGVIAVFTAFGAYLLRLRVVRPLQRLSATARAIADGESGVRVVVDGVRETAEVATAFNDMTDALEGRSSALEKAVGELRESNRSLREARAGLDRAERLAAVGRLAAGVAHEVGNPMGAVLAFLDLAQRDAALSEAARGHLDRAAKQGERVRGILRQLLDFSRPPQSARQPVELPALAEETVELIRAQRRYARIRIEVETEPGAPPALADPGGVAQILLNLLLNAADVLGGETHDPAIRVVIAPCARHRRADDPPGAPLRAGRIDGVACRVEDNGPGVPPEDRERIFDPFFSTKAPGEGTGLGLANAARFAEEYGGQLELDPDHSPGAAFVLTLPAAIPPGSTDKVRRS